MPIAKKTSVEKNAIWTLIPYKNSFVLLYEPRKAVVYYRDYSVDLITGSKRTYSINELLDEFSKIKINQEAKYPRVTHLFYELGYKFQNLEQNFDADSILALDIEFSCYEPNIELANIKNSIVLRDEFRIDKETYTKEFEKGYQHLLKGDCYQFNLTSQFSFSFQKEIGAWEMVSRLWRESENRGLYGSATFIPFLDTLYFSNSPECLFEINTVNQENIIYSRPIKGTVELDANSNLKEKWLELKKSLKNESELLMITDLVKNDLSSIERPVAKVEALKLPLIVPGLLHQYSKLSASLSDSVSLLDILTSLFPGGSITGAPKKRVLAILGELETVDRGFYCGSTVISYDGLLAASINIRSAVIYLTDLVAHYGAGGGITLQSNCADEYNEMNMKVNSFKMLL